MRFMMIVKGPEKAGWPPQELMDAIDREGQEARKNGTMIDSGGLLGTNTGALVRLNNGNVTVTDGPFAEAKEVIGGFAILELKSRKEALDSAVGFMELHKKYWPGWEGVTEVRQMMDGPPK
jgi:hypothetical protein